MKCTSRGKPRDRVRRLVLAVPAVAAFIVLLAPPAMAGAVFGRVFVNDEPLRERTIRFEDMGSNRIIEVLTDRTGNYSVVLPEGTYRVKFGAREARVRVLSYRGRLRQDIEFGNN